MDFSDLKYYPYIRQFVPIAIEIETGIDRDTDSDTDRDLQLICELIYRKLFFHEKGRQRRVRCS